VSRFARHSCTDLAEVFGAAWSRPGLVQEVLGVVARFLPGPTRSCAMVEGKDAEAALAPSVPTHQADVAARRNHET